MLTSYITITQTTLSTNSLDPITGWFVAGFIFLLWGVTIIFWQMEVRERRKLQNTMEVTRHGDWR